MEEVTEEVDVLPLWEGKVIAKVERQLWHCSLQQLGVNAVFIVTYVPFLADRTNGRAYATVLRLSVVCLSVVVCDVMYCG